MDDKRPTWDEYFLAVAKLVSSRATCPRAVVGAVIVRENRIVATGYNGAPTKTAHCTDVGCDIVNGHCLRAVHAEANAIATAARFGLPLDGGTLYLYDTQNRPPCPTCANLLASAGIKEVRRW